MIFLKQPFINTEVYRQAMKNQIAMTGTNVDIILEAVNKYLMILVKEQIRACFAMGEKEVRDIHIRTVEGLETARLNGKVLGRPVGSKIETKKAKEFKALIEKNSKTFGGTNSDVEMLKMLSISRNTYYKYKRELTEEKLVREVVNDTVTLEN